MRVLDDAKKIARRVFDGSYQYAVAYVLEVFVRGSACFEECVKYFGGVAYAPIHYHTTTQGRSVRIEAKLKASDTKTHVERFVEIRPEAQNFGVPIS